MLPRGQLGRGCSRRVRVNANVRKIAADARLHQCANFGVERLSRRTQNLVHDGRCLSPDTGQGPGLTGFPKLAILRVDGRRQTRHDSVSNVGRCVLKRIVDLSHNKLRLNNPGHRE
jgi:hypothetical protein